MANWNKIFKKLGKCLLLILLFSIFSFDHTTSHEEIHSAIARGHGCINSTIEYNIFENSFFRCDEYKPRGNDLYLQERKLHAQNEIVGYYTHLPFTLVCTILFLIIIKLI